ncbi:glycosyltransferase family 2 protein [Sulfitobacter sp. M22]|uniref:glycosyltransferase family 2 protein n=1 Tax=Sulfitobacter sp. M22 TaxID=2675332 RepID=UPI001F460443|nr:glycosyltransferase family A protein [Sulfitobacter sp. M22]MCF7728058.1 glycosyltransferase [Sulfitobacter sp. M22]
MMNTSLAIFVFSFNRANFLENCINSIEACIPEHVPVIILDDNSTDPETVEYLGELSFRYQVLFHDKADAVEMKTGGLYGAMNKAMTIAQHEEFDLVIFIQDDMQFVRRLEINELSRYEKYFEEVPNSIQLSTSFVRELSADSFLQDHATMPDSGAYIRHLHKISGKANFSATGVFSVERFYKLFKKFEVGEGVNSQKARQLGLVNGRAIYPSVCWLPYPISYRGKKRMLKHRFFERFGRSGFYPINLMTDAESKRFLERNPKIVPVMERFLVAPSAPRQDIWSTGGGEYNFVCYGGFFARIFLCLRRVINFLKIRKL